MGKKDSGWGSLFLGFAALGFLAYKENQEDKRHKAELNEIEKLRLLHEEKLKQERYSYYRQKIKEEDSKKEIPPQKETPPTPEKKAQDVGSPEELKRLYYVLSKKYHPDLAQSDIDKKFRTDLFIKIKSAYDRGDYSTMKLYDLG